MESKPANFSLVQDGDISYIERNLRFGKDEIVLKLGIRASNGKDVTLNQLHEASLKTAIQHLQDLLNSTSKG